MNYEINGRLFNLDNLIFQLFLIRNYIFLMVLMDKPKPQRIGFYQYHDVILGKGNFAIVYLARHKAIGCDVALKVIDLNNIEEEYVRRNLSREARILHDLQHPNIIRLYETIKSANSYCLSLELIRGINLSQFMKKQSQRRISERLARLFFYQMLSAVQYMHRLHIIHRDLKQENILVDSGHVIKIADFGLANVYYPCYRLRTHCGSLEYAAPELFGYQSVYGPSVDIWSLGVILYSMVVGKMPFKFSREKSDCPESTLQRELFIKRITKGLMQENWELMEDLTPKCWNILHELLQPDQFRRIQIKDAITHHWIDMDTHLRRRLPQRRRDLQRKFYPEIIEYLAHKLNTSTVRVEKHISASSEGKLACMYYIIRDTLVKEASYPPRDFQSSFLYRFNYWKKAGDLDAEENSEYSEYEELDLEPIESRMTEKSSCSAEMYKKKLTSKNASERNKTMIDSNAKMREKNTVKVISRNFDSVKYASLVNDDCEEDSKRETVFVNQYRSYKKNRPEKVKALLSEQKGDTNRKSGNLETVKTSERKHRVSRGKSFQRNQSTTEERKSENNPERILVSKAKQPSIQVRSKNIAKSKEFKNNLSKRMNATENKKAAAEAQIKSTFSTKHGASDLKNRESLKKTTNATPKAMGNSNSEEETPKVVEQNIITLLTRKQKSPDIPDKSVEAKKVNPIEIPRRFLAKNWRYGPPAPFSQPSDPVGPKKSKGTVADRITFCRGDTNENVR